MSAVCRSCGNPELHATGLCWDCWKAEIEPQMAKLDAGRQTSPPDDAPSATIGLDGVKKKRARWLWRGRVLFGYLTVMAGGKGIGKSTFIALLIARITLGQLDGKALGAPADVMMILAEDGLADMWVPRLEAAGADLARVKSLLIDVEWDLTTGVGRIATAIDEHRPALVYVDAVKEHLPPAEPRETEERHVRRSLAPLRELAQRTGVAVVYSMHPTKSPEGWEGMFAGSGAWTQVARVCLAFAWHPEDAEDDPERRRVIVRAAGNVGRPPRALAFKIDGKQIEYDDDQDDDDEDDDVGYVHAVEDVDVTMRDLLTASRAGQGRYDDREEDGPTKGERLRSYFLELLADGEWHRAVTDRDVIDDADMAADAPGRTTIKAARQDVAVSRRVPGSESDQAWCLKSSAKCSGPVSFNSHRRPDLLASREGARGGSTPDTGPALNTP